MRRDTLINKNVVKAISLALAAVMTATPMTALAEEANVPNDDNNPNADEQNVTEETSVTATADAIDNAQNTISNDSNANDVLLDDPMTLPSNGETLEVVPDAVDAAGSDDLAGVKTNVGEEEIDYTDVDEDLKATQTELEDAEDKLSDVLDAETAAAEDADAASAIADEINANNKVVTDATVAAGDAVAKAEEALAEAQSATNKADAQAAVDKAEEAYEAAEAAQAAAQEAYDANVDKLTAAEEALAAAEANLKAAQDAIDATAEELAAAQAAVDEAAANAEALKAQVDADADALSKSKEAALKAAYDEMMTKKVTKKYNGAALNGTDADADGIGDEFVDEFGTESAESAYWTAADKYFALYLEYVYGDDYVSGKWDKKNTLDNGWDYDAERDNTYTVTYTDANGETKTATYNYHTAADGSITVYEKEIATGWTEEVTEEYQYEAEREVTTTTTVQEERSETTSENVLSIESTDDEGNVTYVKLDDVKKDTDVVVTSSEDEEGNATSVLVMDENSQVVDSDEAELNGNQQIVDGTSSETYTYGTIEVANYGTKEVEADYADRLGDYDNLVKKVNEFQSKYSEDAGYRIEIVFDHGFGNDEVITLEEARRMEWGSELGAWLDCGFEVKVYQTVEDTNNIVGYTTQQVVVKTTTADVATTTQKSASGTAGDRERAKKAAKAKVAELGLAEGTYTISYKDVWDGPFDRDCKYIIKYNETSTSNQVIKTEKYSGTSYEMNTITTTTTWMEDVEKEITTTEKYMATGTKVVKESEEYKYWTERKNTSNDDVIAAAIAGVEKKLADMAAKQDAAAIALAAAKQAQADVEKAQEELNGLTINDSAYQAAVANLKFARDNYAQAEKDLAEINQAVEDAQKDYEDAAKELGRFVPATSGEGGEGTTGGGTGTTTGGGTPAVVDAEPEAEEVEVLSVNTPVVEDVEEVEEEVEESLVTIDDEDVPLASGTGEEAEEQSLVEIGDEEVPLVAMPTEEEKANMPWWWLLIIAVLGATGYKMYKDHQKKNEEVTK